MPTYANPNVSCKFKDESIKEEVRLRQHFEDFFQDTGKRRTSRERSRPPLERPQNPDELEGQNRFDRGTTPGRALVQNLKPAPRKSEVEMLNRENKCDLKNHFKEFMSTTNTMKRARSFSQPRDKKKEEEAENESEKVKSFFPHFDTIYIVVHCRTPTASKK